MAPFPDIEDETEDEDVPPLFKDDERLEMMRAVKRNGGRGRKMNEPIAGEECKDADGNWTKWVAERCTED